MSKRQPNADVIADAIEGWTDGIEFKCSYAHDGDGHFDFMGMKITPEGRAALAKVLAKEEEEEEEEKR